MKPKVRVILEQCIEEGIRFGWRRAHKHVENPSEDAIFSSMEDEIMNKIYEYFEFDEQYND